MLYDAAFSGRQNLSRVLSHEFAHEIFRQLPDSARQEYAIAAGWKLIPQPETRKYRYLLKRFEYVEEDSPSSVTEDFANNVEYYLFNPSKLSKVAPQASGWLLKTYGDKLKLSKGRVK